MALRDSNRIMEIDTATGRMIPRQSRDNEVMVRGG